MSNFSYEEFNVDEEEYDNENESRINLHLDIDYFFAQVEILKNPELKGKPVIVGHTEARKDGRGVVLTCSYEARVFGVHSGLAMKIALDRCPDAIIVKSDYQEYKERSNKIMNILRNLEVPMRQAGIDEVYLDLTPICDDYQQAVKLAADIKQEIIDEVQLTVSIGIAPTLKLAKIGSDYNKPDGVTIITHNTLESIFDKLALTKIPGIGKKTAERLKKKGFVTCDQIFHRSKSDLINLLGSSGEYFYRLVHGETTNRIVPRGERKSVSHSRTFVGDPGDIERSMEYFDKLFDSTYETLIKEEFSTKTVTATVRFNGFDTITRSQSIPHYTTERATLRSMAFQLIEPHLSDERGIRLLGVGFSNLKKRDALQTSLDFFTEDMPEKIDIESLRAERTKPEVIEVEEEPSLDDYF
ncbi:MAG: DNA polymerase IV [Candidatus Kariarchaeaceae archaeon]|jgi:DNA polymerase IV (DinB-like DNA polymerase)